MTSSPNQLYLYKTCFIPDPPEEADWAQDICSAVLEAADAEGLQGPSASSSLNRQFFSEFLATVFSRQFLVETDP